MAKTKAAQRRDAAEEVCWCLMLMMQLGGLEIPVEWRKFLGPSMDRWADLCVETGEMKP